MPTITAAREMRSFTVMYLTFAFACSERQRHVVSAAVARRRKAVSEQSYRCARRGERTKQKSPAGRSS